MASGACRVGKAPGRLADADDARRTAQAPEPGTVERCPTGSRSAGDSGHVPTPVRLRPGGPGASADFKSSVKAPESSLDAGSPASPAEARRPPGSSHKITLNHLII